MLKLCSEKQHEQVDKTLELKKWSKNGPLQKVMKQGRNVYMMFSAYCNTCSMILNFSTCIVYMYICNNNIPTELVLCPEPNDPTNGTALWIHRAVGNIVTYTCSPGYVLVGASSRTCQENAAWTETAPKCERK